MAGSVEQQVTKVPEDVLRRISDLSRQTSTLTVMFHSWVAEQMGLSGTDHKCLDLVARADRPLTAGQIAELSGLSTGAVTGVIDRLERAGHVRRVRDPHDRRKVLVEVSGFDESKYAHLFSIAMDSLQRTLEQFSPDEWPVIERYARTLFETMNGEFAKAAGRRD
ncbi:MarR family winged helix-turn-helix transcriptional regulator [Goodfellowiella coeruleoviolacea]|uniref:DNA-binding transcriptional regulator, MarR family n=1 Tax=Goodfellowiella coeruleoviolacea TaxID=334858 RepID=A0AAE3GJD7_9PSEU|nr:MarR family transcriptional regulator [Goodfellowiella coeruleoviolacea]MCP2169301.1 DNA-binding transcriptional regulator, MarR family [Goodfellowiella coeruleoviolacea]